MIKLIADLFSDLLQQVMTLERPSSHLVNQGFRHTGDGEGKEKQREGSGERASRGIMRAGGGARDRDREREGGRKGEGGRERRRPSERVLNQEIVSSQSAHIQGLQTFLDSFLFFILAVWSTSSQSGL